MPPVPPPIPPYVPDEDEDYDDFTRCMYDRDYIMDQVVVESGALKKAGIDPVLFGRELFYQLIDYMLGGLKVSKTELREFYDEALRLSDNGKRIVEELRSQREREQQRRSN